MTQRIDIDWSDAKDPFEPVPHDNYQLKITSFELGAAKQSGSPMILAEYTIEGDSEFAGRKVFDNMVLQGKGSDFGKFRLRQISEAIGVAPGSETGDYLNQSFIAELGIKPGDDQYGPKNVIKNVFPA